MATMDDVEVRMCTDEPSDADEAVPTAIIYTIMCWAVHAYFYWRNTLTM